jgi:hypothetical protein
MTSKNMPASGEIETYQEQRLQAENLLEVNDVIAFGHGVTFLYMSQGNPATRGCFRTNYSNVVEYALIQHFLLQTFKDYISNEWQRTTSQLPQLGNLSGYTMDAILKGINQYATRLSSGHKMFYNLIQGTRKYAKLEVIFNKMSFDEYWSGQEIFKQLAVTQKTLKTICDNLESDETVGAMLLTNTQGVINALYTKGAKIEKELNNTLQVLFEERNDPVGTNPEKILRLKNTLSAYQQDYEDNTTPDSSKSLKNYATLKK